MIHENLILTTATCKYCNSKYNGLFKCPHCLTVLVDTLEENKKLKERIAELELEYICTKGTE